MEGDAHHPKPFQHQGRSRTLPSKGVHAVPLFMEAMEVHGGSKAFSLCTCCDLPHAEFMWVPVASINPASVSPSRCVGGPIHAYRIPKELSVMVEVPLGVSWLFPCNAALVVYSKLYGFCKGQARQQSPSSFLIAEGCNHKGLTFFHQMM